MVHPTVLVSARIICLLQLVECYDLCYDPSTNRYKWIWTRATHSCDLLNSALYSHPSLSDAMESSAVTTLLFWKQCFSELFCPLVFTIKWFFNAILQTQTSHNHPFLGAGGEDATSLKGYWQTWHLWKKQVWREPILVSPPIFVRIPKICWVRN